MRTHARLWLAAAAAFGVAFSEYAHAEVLIRKELKLRSAEREEVVALGRTRARSEGELLSLRSFAADRFGSDIVEMMFGVYESTPASFEVDLIECTRLRGREWMCRGEPRRFISTAPVQADPEIPVAIAERLVEFGRRECPIPASFGGETTLIYPPRLTRSATDGDYELDCGSGTTLHLAPSAEGIRLKSKSYYIE